jgi:hypothetical protein
MRSADETPWEADFPGSPYTRRRVYEAGIEEARARIRENLEAIEFYSRPD